MKRRWDVMIVGLSALVLVYVGLIEVSGWPGVTLDVTALVLVTALSAALLLGWRRGR